MSNVVEQVARGALLARGYTSRHVAAESGRIHLLEAAGLGSLAPVLLLHGFGSAGVHFRPLLSRLRPHVRRLYVPDAPAHGFSDVPGVSSDTRSLFDGFLHAIDRAIDEPVVVYGNSMGGMAAIRFAIAHPAKVRALILCSPGGAPLTAAELETFKAIFRPAAHKDALEFVDRLLTRPSPLRHAIAFGVRRSFQRPTLQRLIGALSPRDLFEPAELEHIKVPILFIWGRCERILPPSSFEFFVRAFPRHMKVVQPERFGHCPHLEYPGELTRLILEFLSQQSRAMPVVV